MRSAEGLTGRRDNDPIEVVAIPKRTGGTRLLARLNPADQSEYEMLVARLARVIEGRLGPAVVANRVVRGRGLRLEPWRAARRRFRRAIRRLGESTRFLVAVDVRDCYASIGPGAVARSLRELGCPGEPMARLIRLLRSFEERGVRGLPIGPDPSAVLANAVLATVDESLAKDGIEHVRWVDDFVAAASDRLQIVRAVDRLKRAVSEIGLELAEQKTRVMVRHSTRGWGAGSSPVGAGLSPIGSHDG